MRSLLRTPLGLGWIALVLASTPVGAATYVNGFVPDWDQPYTYGPPPPPPGPAPTPGIADDFDAWCTPTSGSNLLGHWEDERGEAVADGQAFPASAPYGGPSYHDFNLDSVRPPPGAPLPVSATDLGWYMDTNRLGAALGNGPHVGTYTKDIHAGLASFLNTQSNNWRTGTRARTFGLGTTSVGTPAQLHPSGASAFAEISEEIDKNRTMIVAWEHWNITPEGSSLAPDPGATNEAFHGVTFYVFGAPTAVDPWENDEDWEEVAELELSLGHTVTAVGYLNAADPDAPQLLDEFGVPAPTDWVIVHDNVSGTPRNVAVPLREVEYKNIWVANTNAVRDTAAPVLPPLAFLLGGASLAVAAWLLARARRLRVGSRA